MPRAVILLQDFSKETTSKCALNLRKMKEKNVLSVQQYIFVTGQGTLRKRNILAKIFPQRGKMSSKNVFGNTDDDVTALCRIQNCILGIVLVSSLSYQSRTVCACAAN